MKKEERRKKTEERRKKNEVVSSGSELKTEKEKEKELVPGRAERTPDVSGEHALRHVKATSMKGICGVEAEDFQPQWDRNLGTGTYCTGALQPLFDPSVYWERTALLPRRGPQYTRRWSSAGLGLWQGLKLQARSLGAAKESARARRALFEKVRERRALKILEGLRGSASRKGGTR